MKKKQIKTTRPGPRKKNTFLKASFFFLTIRVTSMRLKQVQLVPRLPYAVRAAAGCDDAMSVHLEQLLQTVLEREQAGAGLGVEGAW